MTQLRAGDGPQHLIERAAAWADASDAVLHRGDCRTILPSLPSGSVQLVVTSPPYHVGKCYGDDGSGDRLPLDEYLAVLAEVSAELHRVLQDGGVPAAPLAGRSRTLHPSADLTLIQPPAPGPIVRRGASRRAWASSSAPPRLRPLHFGLDLGIQDRRRPIADALASRRDIPTFQS